MVKVRKLKEKFNYLTKLISRDPEKERSLEIKQLMNDFKFRLERLIIKLEGKHDKP